MDRRNFIRSACAAALVPAITWMPYGRAADADAGDPYGAILEQILIRDPETATALGLDQGPRAALKHRLADRSPENRFGYFQALTEWVPRMSGMQGLSARAAIFRAAVVWFADSMGHFREFPYGGVGGYAYPVPYAVSQLTGAYQSVPDFLDTQHTIASSDDAEAYLERLAALAAAIDQDTTRVRADAAAGVSPPAVILDRTLAQLRAFQQGQHGPQGGLVASLVRRTTEQGVAGDWLQRAQAIVDGPIAAAIARQIAAIEALRPSARSAVGVDALPQGPAYYAACLRYHTSTTLTPREAHAMGLEQVARVTAQARRALLDAGERGQTLGPAIRRLMSEPKYQYPNTEAGRAALLAYISSRLEDMTRRLPRAFARLPRTPLQVRRVPPAIELGSPGAYALSGSLDGTRPGAIYFNLHDTANWPSWTVATTAYHEGVPGHHFQGSIANEASDIPTLFKVLGANAYNEGWALYAEQLADELGAYEAEPLGRLGMLQASLFRACRIVVDTGLHSAHWSRERAIRYLIEHAGSTPDDARREIERYVSWPGQACGYKIGHLEFLRLRERARARLGSQFDLRGFHTTVLSYGSLPLQVLARGVDDWIGESGRAAQAAL